MKVVITVSARMFFARFWRMLLTLLLVARASPAGRPPAASLLWWPKWECISYFEIPSPNTTVFNVRWPPSIALWGPWCSPIPWWCTKKHLQVPDPPIYVKLVDLPVLSVLTMRSHYTKPPPYDFLNLYGACLQAPRTPKMK
jgi:hypothetical protein